MRPRPLQTVYSVFKWFNYICNAPVCQMGEKKVTKAVVFQSRTFSNGWVDRQRVSASPLKKCLMCRWFIFYGLFRADVSPHAQPNASYFWERLVCRSKWCWKVFDDSRFSSAHTPETEAQTENWLFVSQMSMLHQIHMNTFYSAGCWSHVLLLYHMEQTNYYQPMFCLLKAKNQSFPNKKEHVQ